MIAIPVKLIIVGDSSGIRNFHILSSDTFTPAKAVDHKRQAATALKAIDCFSDITMRPSSQFLYEATFWKGNQ